MHIFPLTSASKVPFPECLEIKAKPDWRPNYLKKQSSFPVSSLQHSQACSVHDAVTLHRPAQNNAIE